MSSVPLAKIEKLVSAARQRIGQVVYGNDEAVNLLLAALACRGHVLLEGIPGVGKTTLAKTFARVVGLQFSRIQLTPDLMPTDVTGHSYFDQKTQEFRIRQGPVFANVLLADEINRTPPRTQAALLEVMQERQVTIEGTTLPVPDPFMVVATKNPIEVEGVYRLPEAELDRFMVHTKIGYPTRATEKSMLLGKLRAAATPEPLPELAPALQSALPQVRVHDDVAGYLLDIVEATRKDPAVSLGASPRASEQLLQASRAAALMEGREYVVPDDVKRMALPALRHRLLLTSEAEIAERKPETVVAEILEGIPVPVAEVRA